MADSRKRRRIQPMSGYLQDSCPFRFFKVILPSSLEDKKLRIPKKLVKKFGDELCSVAQLTVPDGRVWRVELKKEGGEIWFHDGWHDFVKYHSISVGFFLVFKYAKNSTFDVNIFDMTACEIDYPFSCGEPKHEIQNSVHGDEMEIEDSIEILCSKIPDKNGKCDSQRSLRHCKRRHLINTSEIQSSTWNDEHQNDVVGNGGGLEETAKERPKFDGDEGMTVFEEMGISVSNSKRYHKVEVIQRRISAARMFKPKNPSFMIILQAGDKWTGLHIPAKFTNKYMTTVAKSIKVVVSDGREWPVQTRVKQTGAVALSTGWSGISDRMNLGEGDICLFELIREEEFVLKLSVFYASTEVNVVVEGMTVFEEMGISVSNTKRYHTVEVIQRRICAARMFEPKNPSFMIILQGVDKWRGPHIPAKFSKKYMTRVAKSIKVVVSDGREWPVQTCVRKIGAVALATGWSGISNGMNLGKGDMCLFELIREEEEEFVLKLSVFYASTQVNVVEVD